MLQYLDSRADIKQAQNKLEETIRRQFSGRLRKIIGHRGGREKTQVLTDGHYWFWSSDLRHVAIPRRRNWFGVLGQENHGVSITVEVNTVYQGRKDQVSGFFARDPGTGIVYLLHSGRVGGGAVGVGKDKFLVWATSVGESLADAVDSKRNIRRGLIVMPIEGAGAGRFAARYVDLVRNFKTAARKGVLTTKDFRRRLKEFGDYYGEGRGRRTGQRKSEIDYISRHGDIVDALYKWRVSKPMPPRSRVVKDVLIDMGVALGRKLIEVFEVKSSADRQVIYSALGQLMVHGLEEPCRRVMVLPYGSPIRRDLTAALKRLRIEVLLFRLNRKGVTILSK